MNGKHGYSRLTMGCLLLSVALCSGWLGASEAPPKDVVVEQLATASPEIQALMLAGEYDRAVKRLDRELAEEKDNADYILFLKGLACRYSGKAKLAVNTFLKLERSFPESEWIYKARFHRAEAHRALRQFKEAEAIYEAEAVRLMAEGRKGALAGIYLAFADKLSAPQDKSRPDSPKPDYNRACNLYKKVLDLEVARALRDHAMYRMAFCRRAVKNWNEAIKVYQAYLNEFDPDETETAEVMAQPGAKIFLARYELARCYLAKGDRPRARRLFEDLSNAIIRVGKSEGIWSRVKLALDDKAKADLAALRGDALFAISETYKIGNVAETLFAVSALEKYLEGYAAGDKAPQAAFNIASYYQAINRDSDALSAWDAFLAGKGYQVKSDKLRETHARLTMQALYQKGVVLNKQERFDEAIKVWQTYTARYPTGDDWTKSQQAIINAEYQKGAVHSADKAYGKARAEWTRFLNKYPLDGRARSILYQLGQLYVSEAQDLEEKLDGEDGNAEGKEPLPPAVKKLYLSAIGQWQKLIQLHPRSNEASQAKYQIGRLYETKLNDLNKAITVYGELTWGNYRNQAKRRLELMTAKELVLLTERTWRSGEEARVRAQVRNIETLTVNLYKLNLEGYFRKHRSIRRIEDLDLDLISPDKTFDVKVADYAKYQFIEQDIPLPIKAPGVYAVSVASDKHRATTLVIQSDLDLVVKSSRREVFVFVQDMVKQAGAAGVRILLSLQVASGNTKSPTIIEGVTGSDGVFRYKPDKQDQPLLPAGTLSVYASRKGHGASNLLTLRGLGVSKGLSPRGYVYTDRPVYKPGQEVHLRAVLREVRDGSYAFETGRPYTVEVADSQGRVFYRRSLKLSAFGSLNTEVPLDRFALTGKYVIRCFAREGAVFSGHFQVKAYQLEKIKLTFDLPRDVYYRGEHVSGKIRAAYYYGEPVADAALRYVLPDGRQLTVRTDDRGEADFSFATDAFPHEGLLRIQATLTEERVNAEHTIFLSLHGYAAGISTLRNIFIADEKFDVTVTTRSPAGKPVGRDMSLKVLKRETAQARSGRRGTVSERLVKTLAIKTDEKDGKAMTALALPEGGSYILRVEGTDRFDNPVSADRVVFISDDKDGVKLRFITDTQHLKVGDETRVRLYNRAEAGLALVTFEGEEIITYRLVPLAKGKNELPLKVDHDLFPNFVMSAAMMSGHRFYQASAAFDVARELRIVITPDKESYAPGEKAAVDVAVTDQAGRPVETELSMAVVDEALYNQFGDAVPPIVSFFQEGVRRVAQLRTETSCTFQYRGESKTISRAILEERARFAQLPVSGVTRSGRRSGGQQGWTLGTNLQQAEQVQETAGQSVQVLNGLLVDGQAQWGGHAGQSVQGLSMPVRANANYAFNNNVTMQVDRGFLAGGGGYGGGGALAGGQVRDRFLETAFWTPDCVTGKDGKGRVTFAVPSQATAWKILCRGVTRDTTVGENTARFVSRKDLFLTLKTPASLTEGDRPCFVVRVHNMRGLAGTARLKCRIRMGDTVKMFPADLTLPKTGVTEHTVALPMAVPAVETVKVEAEVAAVFQGKDLKDPGRADRMAVSVPVKPWGIMCVDAKSGSVKTESTFTLSLPGNAPYKQRELVIAIGADTQRMLISEAAGRAPVFMASKGARACATQADAASELLGVCAVMAYLSELGNLEAPEFRLLEDRARSLVGQLIAAQQKNGGWGWAGQKSAGGAITSALSMWSLGRARTLGLTVPDKSISQGVGFLQDAFKKAPQEANELKAMLLFSLTVHKHGDFGYANRLYRLRNSLSPAALAYTILTLCEMDKRPLAVEMVGLLEAKASSLTLPSRQGVQNRWHVAGNIAWNRAPLEMTALAVLAIERGQPRSPFIQRGVDYLVSKRPWYPAKARGVVLAALAYYYKTVKPDRVDAIVTVSVNGKQVKTIPMEGETGTCLIKRSGDELDAGKVSITVTVSGNITVPAAGKGTPHYMAVLRGFSTEVKEKREDRFYVTSHSYLAAPPVYKGREIPTGFGVLRGSYRTHENKVTQLAPGGLTRVRLDVDRSYDNNISDDDHDYLVVEAPIPAGTAVLKDSVVGTYDYYEEGQGMLTFYVGARRSVGHIYYTLLGHIPGEYRVCPVIVRSAYDPSLVAVGRPADMKVLMPGGKSNDQYRPTPDELYHFGKALFDDGLFDRALPMLTGLFEVFGTKLDMEPYRETARMLLFIHLDKGDPGAVVKYFEVIKEKYPELTIPFDKVLAVGQAYRSIEEYERALLVFRATIEETFGKDMKVGGTLEGEGEYMGALRTLERLWLEYPDLPVVVDTYLTLSDKFYNGQPGMENLENGVYTIRPGDTLWGIAQRIYGSGAKWRMIMEANQGLKEGKLSPGRTIRIPGVAAGGNGGGDAVDPVLRKKKMLNRAITLLWRFLTMYPEDPQADQAALSLVSAYLKLEDYEKAASLSRTFADRFKETKFRDQFIYSEAAADWYLDKNEAAIKLAKEVATNKYAGPDGRLRYSENRDLALYIIGQIYHARQKIDDAITYYDKVKQKFSDAADAIAHFRKKMLAIPEVTTVAPGKAAAVDVDYRNIEKVDMLVYSVDLMTLYLREKNLSSITNINLAGISPVLEKAVALGEGKDYYDKKRSVDLKLAKAGAYLVIVRSRDIHTSGLVLVTPLEVDVNEDRAAGRVRVNVMTRADKAYVRDVEVKVIGSENEAFISGKSDPRGLFTADQLIGKATIIVRQGKDHYAFYRGTEFLGKRPPRAQQQRAPQPSSAPSQQIKMDFFQNVKGFNTGNMIQRDESFQKELQKSRKGVQAKQAY